ncbi:hypothetical protein H6F98_30335 [Microcoleus sp. FACHB-SPT15]|uniref:hypothetical protein n=1 Tax=Microcoleus sp. FACHB-SPT15 TaxID=2692830 RepID=UPI00177C8DB6|nr:hypothetical protein [Microcoleus sp. FACHB-SPT15]MBD1809715.1 hypothetical protein [Microcoleus sp. FACHB-SPT15]
MTPFLIMPGEIGWSCTEPWKEYLEQEEYRSSGVQEFRILLLNFFQYAIASLQSLPDVDPTHLMSLLNSS